jgi:hypothetical protein
MLKRKRFRIIDGYIGAQNHTLVCEIFANLKFLFKPRIVLLFHKQRNPCKVKRHHYDAFLLCRILLLPRRFGGRLPRKSQLPAVCRSCDGSSNLGQFDLLIQSQRQLNPTDLLTGINPMIKTENPHYFFI